MSCLYHPVRCPVASYHVPSWSPYDGLSSCLSYSIDFHHLLVDFIESRPYMPGVCQVYQLPLLLLHSPPVPGYLVLKGSSFISHFSTSHVATGIEHLCSVSTIVPSTHTPHLTSNSHLTSAASMNLEKQLIAVYLVSQFPFSLLRPNGHRFTTSSLVRSNCIN